MAESADFVDFSLSFGDLWAAYYHSDSAFTVEMENFNTKILNLRPLKKLGQL